MRLPCLTIIGKLQMGSKKASTGGVYLFKKSRPLPEPGVDLALVFGNPRDLCMVSSPGGPEQRGHHHHHHHHHSV